MNNNIVTQVTRKWRFTCNQCIIEMKDINEKYQTFIFVLLVLIDSVLGNVLTRILGYAGSQIQNMGPKC